MLKRLLPIFTLTGIFIVSIGAVGTHNANADERHGNTFAGSWFVNGTADGGVVPPFTNVATITRDGAIINTDPSFGTGHGLLKRVGHRKVSVKFVTLIPTDDPGFPPGTFLTVTGRIAVSKDGASASGPFLSVFEHPDPDIGKLFSFTGTVEFERITIDGDSDSDSDSD